VSGHTAPRASLRYLARLSDAHGIVEHAEFDRPRREYGYCTDDAGRLLALASRISDDPDALRLATVALGFLERAHRDGAEFRLRQRGDGAWTEDDPSDDAAGRALFGLGTAVAHAPWPEVRRRSLALFDRACDFRSGHLRAVACAVLGAAQVVRADPAHEGARALVIRARLLRSNEGANPAWPWPEERLTYANALLPEASFVGAIVVDDAPAAAAALNQLRWLIERQTREGHFSFSPVGGSDAASTPPMFDQQPIEAWAMASACAAAFTHTHDRYWAEAVRRAAAWFLGENDVGVPVADLVSGGGYDGLESRGVNRNEGAESSMAFVGTMFHLHELARELEAIST
jgi:hypothetical protein